MGFFQFRAYLPWPLDESKKKYRPQIIATLFTEVLLRALGKLWRLLNMGLLRIVPVTHCFYPKWEVCHCNPLHVNIPRAYKSTGRRALFYGIVLMIHHMVLL